MKLFDSAAFKKPSKNKFDLSHERKFSMKFGELIPILCEEAYPGEVWQDKTEFMMRCAPLLFPVMHRNNVFIHNFAVPYRLVWDEFPEFITGGRLGTSAPVHPYMKLNNTKAAHYRISTLADYMGVPIVPTGEVVHANGEQNISALPFRAYQLVYDEYYRDQNVTPSVFGAAGSGLCTKTSGEITNATEYTNTMNLRLRCYEKDYFTSCLPFAQRGAPVIVPSVGDAQFTVSAPTPVTSGAAVTFQTIPGPGVSVLGHLDAGTGSLAFDEPGIGFTINDLRTSLRLQEWLERNARGGARYIEQILVHFGVLSSDARLQRPEYLGGSKTAIQISEVLSNYQDPDVVDGLPQGSMAGHGIAFGQSGGFKRRFEEHTCIISFMSVLPRTGYMQGIPKMFQRFDKLDWLWPEFSNLGEQEVKNKELFWDWTATGDGVTGNEVTFGYQSRYAEFKYKPSTIHGLFRTSLKAFHMAREFEVASKPTLSTEFVSAADAEDLSARVFATGSYDSDYLWVSLFHHMSALRPLSYHAIPSL